MRGVPSDRIQIRYCPYHIRIRTQSSDMDTDTGNGGCEKMIFVSVKIGYESDISGSDADTNRICKNGTIKDKLNENTYITFISFTTILNVIHTMILLCTYQYFHVSIVIRLLLL